MTPSPTSAAGMFLSPPSKSPTGAVEPEVRAIVRPLRTAEVLHFLGEDCVASTTPPSAAVVSP
ncbi:hypothetical protein A2U01_0114839, partial [Trifolium medium]|nr:hypothetical protein [Trifolium medium]